MRIHWRVQALSIVAALGVAAGIATVAAAPALAANCPTVDAGTGAVTPAPSAGVDWAGCDLAKADLASADMAGAQLQNANLAGAYLPNADLAGASLSGATATSATMSGDNLSNAVLTSAYLYGAFLDGADLESADLTNATATAHFIAADMKHANLDGADLAAADLSSADLFGANLTSATYDGNTMWGDATCPNGADANYYVDGCLSAVAVTTPAATPVVTAGTLGNNGWYTSAVTVTWYWIDSNSLVQASCPASTTSSAQGAPAVVTASCTDSSGHTGQGSLSLKIDTTPPVVTMSGVKKGGIYLLDLVPTASCATTDALSGVALNAISETIGGRPDGTGVITAECAAAQDEAGNNAATVKEQYTVLYAFGGYISPRVGSTLKLSSRKITVRFRLANAVGVKIPAKTAAGLAADYHVRATLRGPRIAKVVSRCSWNSTKKYFQCVITRPRHVLTGHRHKYTITVTENVGHGFLTSPPDPFSENPAPYYFG